MMEKKGDIAVRHILLPNEKIHIHSGFIYRTKSGKYVIPYAAIEILNRSGGLLDRLVLVKEIVRSDFWWIKKIFGLPYLTTRIRRCRLAETTTYPFFTNSGGCVRINDLQEVDNETMYSLIKSLQKDAL